MYFKDFRPINEPGEPLNKKIGNKVRGRHGVRTLYQVAVETGDGKILMVGPKWGSQEEAEKLLVEINMMIVRGKEKLWSNPHLIATPHSI